VTSPLLAAVPLTALLVGLACLYHWARGPR
jgi:hypothetical protein